MKERVKLILSKREDLTHDQVLSHYNYNPETGDLHRTLEYDGWNNQSSCFKLIKGCNNRGYKWDKLFGHMFLAHRLIWFYMTGEHPTGEIDHIDGDRLNNKWNNLREVAAFENARNQGERKDNTSGCRGVTYRKNGYGLKRWVARISHKGTRHLLGYFHTREEAVKARKQAEIDYGYHENHAKRSSWVK